MGVYVIAEAGVNHNGSVEIAKKLIDAAKAAGVDCVKFQTFKTENLVSADAKKAAYQVKNTNNDDSQFSMLKKLELSYEDFSGLKAYCDKIGIDFLSTPFDFDSIDFLNGLGMKFWKIPSGEITNYPYLVYLAKTGKPIVMSTGMCDMDDIKAAIKVLEDNGAGEISILHCNTEYPTPYGDVNLRAMDTLRDEFGVKVGYSDHTQGIEISVAAAARGAEIIEKHFTLDRNMEGPDHTSSLEPDELAAMTSAIRNIEKALGSGTKQVSESERKNKDIARKSIVAKTVIKKGEIFTDKNLTAKRPGNGISPMRWEEFIGKPATRDYKPDEQIEDKQ